MHRLRSLVREMGNCVSSHKSTDMKLTVQIQSPDKERNTVKTEQHIAAGAGHTLLPQTSEIGHVDSFRDLSSKEEAFFDSHLWLDSDCEDYFSVNGDLMPSCGNSPVHHKSFIEAPKLDKIPHTECAPSSTPKPSPTEMKKQLFELFRESFNDDPADGNQNLLGQNDTKPNISSPKSTKGSPFKSKPNTLGSGERTPFRGSHHSKQNSAHSAQCCIPSFMRTPSFSERKKRMSPANTNGW